MKQIILGYILVWTPATSESTLCSLCFQSDGLISLNPEHLSVSTLPTWLSEAISDNIPENAAIKKANNILCDSKWRTWRAQGSLAAARTKKDTMISVPSQKLKDLSPENKWWNDREKKQRRKADAVRQMSQELQLIFASNRCHFWLVSSFIPSTYLRSLLPSFICNNSLCEKYFSSLTVRIGFLYLLTQAQTAAAASPLVLQGCRWKKKHTGQI